MSKIVNWGIIGLGNIANTFAKDLLLSNTGKLYAVASRNLEKAKQFSKKHSAAIYYDTYEALVNDPNVDVVYIATPHTLHFENTMLCFSQNKAVLCEKPMGINTRQVKTMVKEAKSKNLFFMEGLWTRFIPTTEKLLELIRQDAIGDIISIQADFGFKADVDFEGRLYNKKLGGGALLDIGIYPIYLSLLLLDTPKDIKAMARMTDTEVDSHCSMLFNYDNKAIANLECSIEVNTPIEAIIYGSKGHIKLHKEFFSSSQLTIEKNGITKTINLEKTGTGYFHEIEEVNYCISNNLKESIKVSLDTSLELISIIDRVKALIGLRYD